MIDITTTVTPIEREYPNGFLTQKWSGSISLKGGEDDNILHWHIVSESPKQIVKTQIGALESMKDAIEKRIKLLESSLID
jgi:hypothetical protein